MIEETPIQLPVYVKKNMMALKESDDYLIKKVHETLQIVNDQNARITHLANLFEELEIQRKAELRLIGTGPTSTEE